MRVVYCSVEGIDDPGRRGVDEVLFGGTGGVGLFSDKSGDL